MAATCSVNEKWPNRLGSCLACFGGSHRSRKIGVAETANYVVPFCEFVDDESEWITISDDNEQDEKEITQANSIETCAISVAAPESIASKASTQQTTTTTISDSSSSSSTCKPVSASLPVATKNNSFTKKSSKRKQTTSSTSTLSSSVTAAKRYVSFADEPVIHEEDGEDCAEEQRRLSTMYSIQISSKTSPIAMAKKTSAAAIANESTSHSNSNKDSGAVVEVAQSMKMEGESFRRRVEWLKQQGGQDWLKVYSNTLTQ